ERGFVGEDGRRNARVLARARARDDGALAERFRRVDRPPGAQPPQVELLGAQRQAVDRPQQRLLGRRDRETEKLRVRRELDDVGDVGYRHPRRSRKARRSAPEVTGFPLRPASSRSRSSAWVAAWSSRATRRAALSIALGDGRLPRPAARFSTSVAQARAASRARTIASATRAASRWSSASPLMPRLATMAP